MKDDAELYDRDDDHENVTPEGDPTPVDENVDEEVTEEVDPATIPEGKTNQPEE